MRSKLLPLLFLAVACSEPTSTEQVTKPQFDQNTSTQLDCRIWLWTEKPRKTTGWCG